MPHRPASGSRLIALQRAMVRRLKRRMKEVIEQTPELVRYYEEYRAEVHEFEVPSYPGELATRCAESDIAYVGDFHTLQQSQKLFLRLLAMTLASPARRERPLVVALEAFHSAHQRHLDAYLAKQTDLPTLLTRCRYARTWGFPVAGYQSILEFCRERGVPVIGINSTPRTGENLLARRDQHAARTILKARKRYPRAQVMVLIGDLHVATNHLPLTVLDGADRQGETIRDVIVYTNSEAVYWRLMEMNLEYIVNVVKFSNRRYCVMNATPLAKYDSYLRFVEGVLDQDDGEDLDQMPLSSLDFEEQIRDFAERIRHFLGLPDSTLPDFELVQLAPEETVAELVARCEGAPAEEERVIASLRARHPFFIGPHGLYLHRYTLNDAADAAVRLLLRSTGWETDVRPHKEAYFQMLLHEALVFFAAKVINPKRVCKRLQDWEAWLQQEHRARPVGQQRSRLAVLRRYVVPHLEAIWQYVPAVPGQRPRFQSDSRWWRCALARRLEATRLLGARLGERLFYSAQVGLPAARVRAGQSRRLTRAQIAAMMLSPPTSGHAFECYVHTWAGTADVVEHHRTRQDWF